VRTAYELADSLNDDALRAGALTQLGQLGAFAGDPESLAHATRASELAAALGDPVLVQDSICAAAEALIARRSLDAARALLERALRDWLDRDEAYVVDLHWWLAWVELWAGRWACALDHAATSQAMGLQYGVDNSNLYLPPALVALHRGDLDSARVESERLLDLSEQEYGRASRPLAAVGLLALWSGDALAAADRLGEADRRAAELGLGEPGNRWWTADYVEALLELGRIDEAARVVDVWESDAARLDRAWVLAQVARCRGLLASARGDVDGASMLLEQATVLHEAVGDPFGQARALLALGVVRRRARQKRAARAALDDALARFELLGAATWVVRAREELGAVGGRSREEGLTGAERRVAELVAEGRTNREVAAALFLGERTVAGHLTRIYAKLGVRSRTELARKVQTF
jgi:DNA-binding CsgD family transcriptional regulator